MILNFKKLANSNCTITTVVKALSSHPKVFEEYLDQAIESGTFPFSETISKYENTFLQLIIANESFDVAQLLLKKCLKYERYEEVLSLLHAQDSNGRTPLLLATLLRNSDIVKMLIDTERQALDHLGQGGRSLPSLVIKDNKCFTPLDAAVIISSTEIVSTIIGSSDESFKRDIDIEKLKRNRAAYHTKNYKHLKRLLKSIDIDGDRAANAIGNQFSFCSEKDPKYGFLTKGVPLSVSSRILDVNVVKPNGHSVQIRELLKPYGITDKHFLQQKNNIVNYEFVMNSFFGIQKIFPEYISHLRDTLSEHSFLDACTSQDNIKSIDLLLLTLQIDRLAIFD